MIDEEVRAFVDSAYKRTLGLVEQHKDLITDMSLELLKKEVRQVLQRVGGRDWAGCGHELLKKEARARGGGLGAARLCWWGGRVRAPCAVGAKRKVAGHAAPRFGGPWLGRRGALGVLLG